MPYLVIYIYFILLALYPFAIKTNSYSIFIENVISYSHEFLIKSE